MDPIFQAVAEANINALKDILDHNPDCVNITSGLVCELTITIIVSICTI